MIPDDFIQTLLTRIDIVEVIDRRVPLKKAGANYVACCPFHQEKTPSFSVSPGKQFYHCFGCGAHGTAIGFLMEYAGQSFREAVEELARDAGLVVPEVKDERRTASGNRRETAPDLAEIMKTAAHFYYEQLKSSPRAIDYLKQRGLSGEVARRFQIGYAPEGWTALKTVFPEYDRLPLDELGMVVVKDDGKRYDRFRDRIMFPIHTSSGKIIGFGGRVLDKGEPKYLNSPETPLFSKGRELYGLFQARDAIRKQGCVLVVEGYMDVVALAQHGIEYCVATLGTATTAIHTQKLYRLTDHVVFCFDGDNAGKKAAWRALNNTLPVLADGKRASFLFLPDELDPDEFVRQRGRDAFEQAITQATPLSEYLLTQQAELTPPDSDEGRAAFVSAIMPQLAAIRAPALSTLLRRRVAAIAGLPEGELRQMQGDAATQEHYAPSTTTTSRPARNPRPSRRPPSLVREILQAVLQQPQLACLHDIPHADDPTPEAALLNEVVAYCRAAETIPPLAAIIQYFSGTRQERLIQELLRVIEGQALPDEENALQFHAAITRWTEMQDKQQMTQLLQRPLSQLSEEERRRVAQWRKPTATAEPTVPPPTTQAHRPSVPLHAKRPVKAKTPVPPFDEEPPPF